MFRCWLTLVLVLVTLGCRHASQDIELLESELRWLEDQVYLLDEQLQLRTAELESSRRSNLALKNLLATRDAGPSRSPAGAESETPLLDSVIPRLRDPVTPAPRIDRDPGTSRYERLPGRTRPPVIDRSSPRRGGAADGGIGEPDSSGATEPDDLDLLQPPTVDLGEEGDDDPLQPAAPGDGAHWEPAGSGLALSPLAAPAAWIENIGSAPSHIERHELPWNTADDRFAGDAGSARQPIRLELNRRVTGGHDFDDCPGDDGLIVLLQTFDAQGTPAKIVGPVTIELRDPGAAAEGPPIGRWDLDASVIATRYSKTLFGEGVHLELPWSDPPMRSGLMDLTAKLLTEDGKWLTAKRQVPVDAPLSAAAALRSANDAWAPQRPAKLFGTSGPVPPEPSLLPDASAR